MGDSVAEPSPSRFTYCYSLECSVRIESTSTEEKKPTLTAKNATITLGRNASRQILLQVELNGGKSRYYPAFASYSLADCIVHQQGIGHGKGSIEIPSRKMVVQLSNCAPRRLNVFLKSLQAKIDIMNAECKSNSNTLCTPISVKRTMVLQGLPKVFNILSPLSIDEIRRVRRMRGVATGDSPLCKATSGMPNRNKENSRSVDNVQSTTPKVSRKRISYSNMASDDQPSKHTIQLSDEQRAVIRAAVQSKQNLFFTGSAGTGKSLILRRIIELLPASTTFITAATGVAACHLGGVTLHSFAGIGVGGLSTEQSLRIANSKKNIIKQWRMCSHLIIDEISMVDAEYFTNIEYVARSIRGDNRPFGGIQLIITGDFLQLPPVVKNTEELKFCFESPAWNRSIQKIIILEQVQRQTDHKFISILQQIRMGRCNQEAIDCLVRTKDNNLISEGIVPTRLCTHTADADAINLHSLEKLNYIEKIFESEDSHCIPDSVQQMVPKRLVLKSGAQVMLNKNIDLSRGLSNGSRGVIMKFSKMGFPIVKFLATNDEIEIRPVNFSVHIPGVEKLVYRRQLPLQLAWAISIHKSQGLTLDAVEVTLTKVFADGQSYVALSRARSLSAIKVLGFDLAVVQANKKVIRYYETIKENSLLDDNDRESFIIRKRSRISA